MENLDKCVSPVITYLNVFALSESSSRKICLKKVWNIVCPLSLLLLTYLMLPVKHRFAEQFGRMMIALDILSTHLNLITMFFVLLFRRIREKPMKTFINLLSTIDKEFINYHDFSKIYGSIGRWIMSGVVFVIGCFLALLIVQLIVIWEGNDYTFLSDLVTITLPIGLTMASQIEFCVLIRLVEQRLFWLGSTIKAENKTESTQKMIRISKGKKHYTTLCNVIDQMQTKFSVEILMVVLKNFVGLIALLCFWITKVDVAYERTSAAFTVYLSLLLISLGAQIIIPVMVCSRSVQKAKKTGSLLHSIVPPSHLLKNRETLQIQLSCFSLQLANHNIEFNACGVFLINESLIYSIIGAASAYLVIVIQFELSSNSALTINNRTVIVAS